MAAVSVTAVLRRRQELRNSAGVARYRFAMPFLFSFSLWGALHGFMPAIFVALKGVADGKLQYVGNLPGPFTPMFIFFSWAGPRFSSRPSCSSDDSKGGEHEPQSSFERAREASVARSAREGEAACWSTRVY